MKIKNILVSQPQPQNPKSPYFELAKKHNLKIDFRPFIHVEGISAKEFRQQKISIPDFSAVILTSKTAADHYFRICEELRINVPETLKYFCITESVAFYLQKFIIYRKRKIFYGKGRFSDLMEVVNKHKDESYFVPLSNHHKAEIPSLLTKNKINHQIGILYNTVASDLSDLKDVNYDVLVFYSPSGIRSLLKNFPEFEQNNTLIASFGPTTAKAVKDAGLRLDIAAPNPKAPSMTMALEDYLKSNGKAE